MTEDLVEEKISIGAEISASMTGARIEERIDVSMTEAEGTMIEVTIVAEIEERY